MYSRHYFNKLVPLPFVLVAFFVAHGCAHQSAAQLETHEGAMPYYAYPGDITGVAPSLYPPFGVTDSATGVTDGTEAVTDSTEAVSDATGAPQPRFERASPPALGAETLTELADARFPSYGASLSLAQEGRLAWLNHDPIDARQKLQSALQIWGNNPYAHYYLGMLELEAGHYALAMTFAKTAVRNLRSNPFWNARAYLLLSETLERSGDQSGAFEARTKAFDLDPRVELR